MISPYKRWPERVRVAVLTDRGVVIHEDRGHILPAQLAPDTRCFASYETVGELVHEGVGQALSWNDELVRWRPVASEKWNRDPCDVRVMRVPFPDPPESALNGVRRWRDWLQERGAGVSSLGQSSYSLLRTTLRRPLYMTYGDAPPITWTMGARVQLCVPKGVYEGDIAQLDLPAAYASELGNMPYGGQWVKITPPGPDDLPCFWSAEVRIPSRLSYGPLPRRPRKRRDPWQSHLNPVPYPVGTTMRGVWTQQELQAAAAAGCRVRARGGWLHVPHGDGGSWRRPFLPWWRAIEEGRAQHGFAGFLAKVTGNALFGQLCMSPGRRETVTFSGRQVDKVALPSAGGRPPAHDLAESVSGRVRAKLYQLMMTAPDQMLCVHTDGAWTLGDVAYPGWRRKERADWLQLISPQVMAYGVHGADPNYVFAGVPYAMAQASFTAYWRALFGPQPSEFERML